MATSKAPTPDHRVGCTRAEYAVFCWLRLHGDVAATYGIKSCNGKTTIGSMLLQLLTALGADIDWHDALPDGSDELSGNDKAAAFISKFSRRQGRRMKTLRERLQELLAKDHVAPQATAAIGRKDGKAPRLSAVRHVARGPARPRRHHRDGAGRGGRRRPCGAAPKREVVHVPYVCSRAVGLPGRGRAREDRRLRRRCHPLAVPRAGLRLRSKCDCDLFGARVYGVSGGVKLQKIH
jgi:hypothetical protein